MDAITIENFRADTTIGIHDWEQRRKQPVILNITLEYDCQPAADSDDISDALDYFQLTEHLKTYLAQNRCALIEKLAQQRIETCKGCEFFKDEKIDFLKVDDKHLPEASGKFCEDCGCIISYKLRQTSKLCPKWGE